MLATALLELGRRNVSDAHWPERGREHQAGARSQD